MRFLTLIIAMILWIGTCRPALAEVPEPIDVDALTVRNINRTSVYLLDAQNTLTIEDVLHHEQDWQHPESGNLAFPLEKTTAWVHLRLSNPQAASQTIGLELNPVFLEEITLYDAQGRIVNKIGSTVVSKKLQAFPTLTLTAKEGLTDYYLSIRSRANSLSLIARSDDLQQQKASFDVVMVGGLVGGLFALLIYHLFQYFAYYNRNYLLYSFFVATTALFTLSFTSFHLWLLPAKIGSFHLDFWWSALAAELMSITMYVFSIDLLKLYPNNRKGYSKLGLALLVFPIIEVGCLAFIFLANDPVALIPVRLISVLQMFVFPVVGLYLWRKNRSNIIPIYYAISWIPSAIGAFVVVAWLSGSLPHHNIFAWSISLGALAQSLFLSFAAGLQLKQVTADKLREQSDKVMYMEQLQDRIEALNTRDKVITAFVSPEIVRELDNGLDPMRFEPCSVEKCIAFLDMRDYTGFSENHSTMECYEVINEYFTLINKTIYEGGGRVDKIIGDAMMIVFDDPAGCLHSVVQLRRNLSDLNRERFNAHKTPIRFGLGVHYGKMLAANFGSEMKFDRTIVGDTVNVASRLETITKAFAVDVLCSFEFVHMHQGYQYFRPAGYVLLKGRKSKSLVYELFEHNIPEVIDWKISTKPHLARAVELELEGKYSETLAIIHDLIAHCPMHTIKPGMIMDPTLLAIVKAIEEKLTSLGLPIPTQQELALIHNVQLMRVS